MADSEIVAFYCGRGTDDRGRSLASLQQQDLDELEEVHDYVQWLFPLPEPSGANPWAPLLTRRDMAAFRADPELRRRLLDSVRAMFRLCGLRLAGDDATPVVVRAPEFAARSREWITPYGHNFLRLSRILRSLKLLGCPAHAKALLRCLVEIHAEHARTIGPETLAYWRRAAR